MSDRETGQRRAVWANGHFWDSPIRIGGHHYARLLAEAGWKVAFCSDPISPFHLVKFDTIRESRDRARTWIAGGRTDLDGRLFYYTPMTLCPHYDVPGLRHPRVLDHWHRLTVPNAGRVLRQSGFDQPDLLVLDSVNQAFWREVLNPRKVILRVADDLSGFRGVTPAMLRREEALIGSVDHVFYTAHRLEARIAPHRPKAMTHVPNGVDLAHFLKGGLEPPPEYAHIPEPRAVYVGAIDDWFDTELVAAAAGALPHVSFVIVGPPRRDLSALQGLANVFLLGRKPYADVPAYMKAAQVGLIPFRVNEMIHAVHPIKLYEYLACGLPVVSVAWDELESLASPAWLSRDTPQFIDNIRRALSTPPPRDDLVRYASASAWACRLQTILGALGY